MQKRVLNLRRSLSLNHLRKYRHLELAASHGLLLPSRVDRRPYQSQVWDQGQTGSCSAFSAKSHIEELQLNGLRASVPPGKDPMEWASGKFTPVAPFFHYWNTRALEGSTHTDAGASTLVDVATALETKGAVAETTWPTVMGNLLKCPPSTAYAEGYHHRLPLAYSLDQNITELKRCLNNGFGFLFGVLVYDSFMGASNGWIPVPDTTRESVQGGHALYMVGYDDASGCFIFKNSWGIEWGIAGYGMIPYTYILDPNLCFDLVTLRLSPMAA
jgi:hypothetical protein